MPELEPTAADREAAEKYTDRPPEDVDRVSETRGNTLDAVRFAFLAGIRVERERAVAICLRERDRAAAMQRKHTGYLAFGLEHEARLASELAEDIRTGGPA